MPSEAARKGTDAFTVFIEEKEDAQKANLKIEREIEREEKYTAE